MKTVILTSEEASALHMGGDLIIEVHLDYRKLTDRDLKREVRKLWYERFSGQWVNLPGP